jgi:hypothetical protein
MRTALEGQLGTEFPSQVPSSDRRVSRSPLATLQSQKNTLLSLQELQKYSFERSEVKLEALLPYSVRVDKRDTRDATDNTLSKREIYAR